MMMIVTKKDKEGQYELPSLQVGRILRSCSKHQGIDSRFASPSHIPWRMPFGGSRRSSRSCFSRAVVLVSVKVPLFMYSNIKMEKTYCLIWIWGGGG